MSQVENNWYVLVGDQKYGPYEYKSMIRMLQTNQLMDYNYVWAPHIESWTQIHQIEEFSTSRLKLMIQNDPDFKETFVKRVHARAPANAPILGHNHIRFFDGQIVSVSEAGALCMLNTPLIQLGDKLKLHIKSGPDNTPAFNVEGEVIRKNFSKQRLNSKSGLYYAVRFNDIQPIGLKTIKQWLSNKAG